MDTTQNINANARRNIADSGDFDDRASALREQVSVVGQDMRQLAATAGEAAMELTDPIEEYILEKPWKAVFIAAGVGALFGILFLRR